MAELERLRMIQRPLADREREDLKRQGRKSEQFMLGHWARAVRRWCLIGCGVLALLGALWWATVRWDLDRTRSAVAATGAAIAFLAISAWKLYEARARVTAARAKHKKMAAEAAANPVFEIEVSPARVWGSLEDGWMFDVGGGRALLADWDLPEGSATARIVASVSPAGGVWFDQSGEELPAEALPYLWENLRDDHPLLELVGPVTFRLGADAGASLRDFHNYEWLVPPEIRNPD